MGDSRIARFLLKVTFSLKRQQQATALQACVTMCVCAKGSVIFSRMKYGVGQNKKYPTKEARLLFGYFLLSPTNLFVAKITREIMHYL